MAPGGQWELAFLFWRQDLFFARKREKKCFFFLVFGGVIALFGGDFAFLGVISRFFGCFRATRPLFRAQRDFFGAFFSPRGREQNVKFPLWPTRPGIWIQDVEGFVVE